MKLLMKWQDWALYQPEHPTEIIGFFSEEDLELLKQKPLGLLLWHSEARAGIMLPCVYTHYRHLGYTSHSHPEFFRNLNDALEYIRTCLSLQSPPESIQPPPSEAISEISKHLGTSKHTSLPDDSCIIWKYHSDLLLRASNDELLKEGPHVMHQIYDLVQLVDHLCLADKIVVPFSSSSEKKQTEDLLSTTLGLSDDVVLWDAGERENDWYAEVPAWHNYFEGYLKYAGLSSTTTIPREDWQTDVLELRWQYKDLALPLYAKHLCNTLAIPIPYHWTGVFCNAVRPGGSEVLFSLIRLHIGMAERREKMRALRLAVGGHSYLPISPISNVVFSRCQRPEALGSCIREMRSELAKTRTMLRQFREACRDDSLSLRQWDKRLRDIQRQYQQVERVSSFVRMGNGTDGTRLVTSDLLDDISQISENALSEEGIELISVGKGILSYLAGKTSRWLLERWKNRHIAPLFTILKEDADVRNQLQVLSQLFQINLTNHHIGTYRGMLKAIEFMHSPAFNSRTISDGELPLKKS